MYHPIWGAARFARAMRINASSVMPTTLVPFIGTISYQKGPSLLALWRSVDVQLAVFFVIENTPDKAVIAAANEMGGGCETQALPVWLEARWSSRYLESSEEFRVCVPRHSNVHEYHVLRWLQNNGVARGWNTILRHGFGLGAPYVVVANDDIAFTPNSLHTFHKFTMLQLRKQPIFFASMGMLVKGMLVKEKVVASQPFSLFSFTQGLVERVGYYDENFFPAYYEDTDMRVRFNLLAVETYMVPNATFTHQSPPGGTGVSLQPSITQKLNAVMHRRSCNAVYFARKWKCHVKYDKWGWGRIYADGMAARPSEGAKNMIWRHFSPSAPWPHATRRSALATALSRWYPVDIERRQYSAHGNATTCFYCLPQSMPQVKTGVCKDRLRMQS